jgi:hypothetical protein
MITYKFHADTSALNDLNREFMRAVRMSYQTWQHTPDQSYPKQNRTSSNKLGNTWMQV